MGAGSFCPPSTLLIRKLPFWERRDLGEAAAVIFDDTPGGLPSYIFLASHQDILRRSLRYHRGLSKWHYKRNEWIIKVESMDNSSIANGVGGSYENGDSVDMTKGTISSGHKRSLSGSLLSKLSFLRASAEANQTQPNGPLSPEKFNGDEPSSPKKTGRALAEAVQQQKTRRRKGSLRKAALLGRGAQREKREQISPLNTSDREAYGIDGAISPTDTSQNDALGLGILDIMSRHSPDQFVNHVNGRSYLPLAILDPAQGEPVVNTQTISTSPTLTYTSTTDEEDILSLPKHLPTLRNEHNNSSGSDSYFPPRTGSLTRRRSTHKPTSPLSIGGLAANTLPVPDADWDYSETEWWGWVVLIVTWIVFVVGMGSCLGVWSWAWDVGETPYAPPELEDDPTLPIVGYYPALIILTAVMAWVWVVVAWVGMKYFRHAKISGD
jgi:hypothetical protein